MHETLMVLVLSKRLSDGCQIGIRSVSDRFQIGVRLVVLELSPNRTLTLTLTLMLLEAPFTGHDYTGYWTGLEGRVLSPHHRNLPSSPVQ